MPAGMAGLERLEASCLNMHQGLGGSLSRQEQPFSFQVRGLHPPSLDGTSDTVSIGFYRPAMRATAVRKFSPCLCAAGWVYAEVTTEDTLALRGLFLQLQSIQAHLEAARIEEHLELRPLLRFPHFYEVASKLS